MERVFSGVQPTGNLHLGELSRRDREVRRAAGEIFLPLLRGRSATPSRCGRTRPICAAATREVTAAFIAAGVDPKKNIVFNQSQVQEHAELAWIFNCVARLGWLNRMTQFKEKAGKDRENASVGLYAYPNLMAADILALPRDACAGRRRPETASRARARHRAEVQQRLCESIKRRRLSDEKFFPLPEPLISGPATRVMSPARRRQEDVEVGPVRQFAHQPDRRCRHHRAEDQASEDRLRAAAERGKGLEPRPEADNLVGIYAALSGKTKQDVLKRIRRRPVLDLQERAGRSRGRETRPDRRRDEAADAGQRAMSTAILIDGANRARVIAGGNPERGA